MDEGQVRTSIFSKTNKPTNSLRPNSRNGVSAASDGFPLSVIFPNFFLPPRSPSNVTALSQQSRFSPQESNKNK